MIRSVPTPARARSDAWTVPRAPQPTSAAFEAIRRAWPCSPISSNSPCLEYRAGTSVFSVTGFLSKAQIKKPLRDDVEEVRGNDSFAFRLSSAEARRPRRSWHRPSRTIQDRLPWDHRACPSPTLDKMEVIDLSFRSRNLLVKMTRANYHADRDLSTFVA